MIETDPERQRELASAGGKAAHVAGTAHRYTPDEARAAGAKGGKETSKDREYMGRIGRRGGEARAANIAKARAAETAEKV